MKMPDIVSQDEWTTARDAMNDKEQAAATSRRELAAERRRMPMVRVEREYRFDGPDGPVTLPELFDGRRQLITYRFFFDEGVSGWPDAGCEGCSMFTDGITDLAHLHARDVTMVLLSPAPQDKLQAYRRRMGWDVPWFTLIDDDFSVDFGVSEWFGINVFLRDGGQIHRTYFLEGPAVEGVGNVWSLLELTPYGRRQEDEDSPEGWPQDPPYAWYRRHDEYDAPRPSPDQ